jgi:hypothetical protein
MGGASSKTTAESITNQLMSVVANVNANAFSVATAANIATLSGECQIDGVINQNIFMTVDASIFQKAKSIADTKQALTTKVTQISEAESPNLSLAAGSESETFTSLIQNVATQIENNVGTVCGQSGGNLNSFNCSGKAKVTEKGEINQEIVATYLFECSQEIEAVSKAQQDLQVFIDQHSTAKVTDALSGVLIAFAVIAGLVVLTIVLFPGLITSTITKVVTEIIQIASTIFSKVLELIQKIIKYCINNPLVGVPLLLIFVYIIYVIYLSITSPKKEQYGDDADDIDETYQY